MSKRQSKNGTPDFKNSEGLWVKTHCPFPNELHQTRSYSLWCSLTKRCIIGGYQQTHQPTYVGCCNYFSDFQEFAEWCQSQFGLMNKDEDGNFWQIDKDLLSAGNKVYSKDTCMFIPKYINTMFTDSFKQRGEYPVGVSLYRNGRFRSYIGKPEKHLGYFKTAEEAHRAWQLAKIASIDDVIRDPSIQGHIKLIAALEDYKDKIQEDFDNFLITESGR